MNGEFEEQGEEEEEEKEEEEEVEEAVVSTHTQCNQPFGSDFGHLMRCGKRKVESGK